MDKLIEAMKVYFATNFQYYTKAHGYHVNVVGPNFFQYHKLLEDIYDDAQDNIDTIAEKIRALHAVVPFSLTRITELSEIEDADDAPKALDMISELLEDTNILMDIIREAHELAESEGDYGLLNYLEQRMDDHSKFIWMLKATLQ